MSTQNQMLVSILAMIANHWTACSTDSSKLHSSHLMNFETLFIRDLHLSSEHKLIWQLQFRLTLGRVA